MGLRVPDGEAHVVRDDVEKGGGNRRGPLGRQKGGDDKSDAEEAHGVDHAEEHEESDVYLLEDE